MKRFTLASTPNDISVFNDVKNVLAFTVKESTQKFENGDVQYVTVDCFDSICEVKSKPDYLIMAGNNDNRYAYWKSKVWKVVDKPVGDFLNVMAGIKKEDLEKFTKDFIEPLENK
jgi:hypothetical protein